MKIRTNISFWLVLFCLALVQQAGAQGPQDTVITLNVLHTNDTHSCVMPINKNFADTALADKGGYLRREAFVEQMRRKDADLLLFDSGDFSQGSAYYNLFHGEVEVGLMNRMHYDAATIGNHEFDFGLENMKRIFEMAQFPIVCANYDFSKTILKDVVKPYTILHRKGMKIGVFGISPQLEGLVAKSSYGDVVYQDPVKVANEVASHLKLQERCDLVICLSHLGWAIGNMNDEVLINNTRYIDMVLGGHSHTYFTTPLQVPNADGQPVICNQMGKSGRFVGSLEVEMQPVRK